MPVRLPPLALLFSLLYACGNGPAVEDAVEIPAADTVRTIAGYDVAHWEATTDDFFDAPQKMTKHHVLGLAAVYCDSALLAQALADGANPNLQTQMNPPVHEAALCPDNAVALVRMFLAAGVDINAVDEYDENVLSYAIAADSLPIVTFLLDNGAAILDRDNVESYRCPPIFSAKSPRMLDYLLGRGLTLTEGCASGRTLLHSAAAEDNTVLIEYLLANDLADPAATDENGETAWDYATNEASGGAQDLLRPYRTPQ